MLTGTQAPESLVLTVTPNAAIPDLTVVTAASFAITDPNNAKRVWAATILSKTASVLVLSYVFASGDQDETGKWRAVARLSLPGGVRRTTPFEWSVDEE